MTDDEIVVLHRRLASETLRADEGWQRYQIANEDRIQLRNERVRLVERIEIMRDEIRRLVEMIQFANNVIHESKSAEALLHVLAEPKVAP